jgi:hypothetical protein
MESSDRSQAPSSHHQLVAQVDEAEAAALRWAGSLSLPRLFYTSLGVAIAIQVFSASWGIAANDGTGLVVAGAGVAFFAVVAATQLIRFRRANGVWVSGLASQVVLGSAPAASTVYALSVAGCIWAQFEDRGWLAAICAGLGGAGYAICGIFWWHRYQQAPQTHARAESRMLLIAMGLLGLLGAVLLLVAA